MQQQYMPMFSLGPVQTFIAQARKTRDLWQCRWGSENNPSLYPGWQRLLLSGTNRDYPARDGIWLANWLWHYIYRRNTGMIVATTTLYLYVETPLHAGVGSGLSIVDLPIQRERTTQYPTIQGSGIKGKLRALATDVWDRDDVQIIFGPEDNGAEHAGALIAGDARILLFPVRSLNGVFAYTTSLDVLARFQRDLQRGGESLSWGALLLAIGENHRALVAPGNVIAADNTVVLEEFSFDVQEHAQVTAIATWLAEHALPQAEEYKYWREKVKNSLIILPENDFRDFVVNATEIITRVRIDRDTKTVQDKAL